MQPRWWPKQQRLWRLHPSKHALPSRTKCCPLTQQVECLVSVEACKSVKQWRAAERVFALAAATAALNTCRPFRHLLAGMATSLTMRLGDMSDHVAPHDSLSSPVLCHLVVSQPLSAFCHCCVGLACKRPWQVSPPSQPQQHPAYWQRTQQPYQGAYQACGQCWHPLWQPQQQQQQLGCLGCGL